MTGSGKFERSRTTFILCASRRRESGLLGVMACSEGHCAAGIEGRHVEVQLLVCRPQCCANRASKLTNDILHLLDVASKQVLPMLQLLHEFGFECGATPTSCLPDGLVDRARDVHHHFSLEVTAEIGRGQEVLDLTSHRSVAEVQGEIDDPGAVLYPVFEFQYRTRPLQIDGQMLENLIPAGR